MKARVVHHSQPHDVFIGQPGTRWGYPAVIGRDGTADECFKKYEAYLQRRSDLTRYIRQEIHGKVLGCTCQPGDLCHGQALVDAAEQDYRSWTRLSSTQRRRLRPAYQTHRYMWDPFWQEIKETWSQWAYLNDLDCVETDLDEEDPIIRQALIDYLTKDL